MSEIPSNRARDLPIQELRQLQGAFYALAHNDFTYFEKLDIELKQTDVGQICQEYIQTRKSDLINQAGTMLAGKHWYVALGR